MATFSDRLNRCVEKTEMTTSDVARWFNRPRATVNTWINGRTPFGPAAVIANKNLDLLEFSIKTRASHYPVPAELTWIDREKYVRGMYNDARSNHRVSEMRAAG